MIRVLAVAAALLLLAACTGSSGRRGASRTAPTTPSTTPASPTTSGSPTGASPTTAPPPGPPDGPLPRGFQPASVTFVSADDGWVLGTAPCSARPCTSLARTRDGGRTWHGIPAPRAELTNDPQSVDNAGGVSRIRFADPLNGWAFGTTLFATHDGGATWKQLNAPDNAIVADVEASAGRAFAAGIGNPNAPNGTTIELFTTPVGSDSWQRVPNVSLVGGGSPAVSLRGRAGWLSAGSSVLRSDDGTSWRAVTLNCPLGEEPVWNVQLGGDQAVLAVCSGSGAAGTEQKGAVLSHDGGATFAPQAAPPPAGDFAGAAIAPGGAELVAASSGASWLYASFDGGKTWSTVLEDSQSGGAPWADVGFTTDAQAIAVEGSPVGGQSSRLWISRDGGHHWSPVAFG